MTLTWRRFTRAHPRSGPPPAPQPDAWERVPAARAGAPRRSVPRPGTPRGRAARAPACPTARQRAPQPAGPDEAGARHADDADVGQLAQTSPLQQRGQVNAPIADEAD